MATNFRYHVVGIDLSAYSISALKYAEKACEEMATNFRYHVVGIDLSAYSISALKYAEKACVSDKECDTLLLVTVVDMTKWTGGDMLSFIAAQHELKEAELRPFAESLSGKGIRFKTIVMDGDPKTEIIRVADNFHARTIVLGVRGIDSAHSSDTGSPGVVAEGVQANAHCPVVLIDYEREKDGERTLSRTSSKSKFMVSPMLRANSVEVLTGETLLSGATAGGGGGGHGAGVSGAAGNGADPSLPKSRSDSRNSSRKRDKRSDQSSDSSLSDSDSDSSSSSSDASTDSSESSSERRRRRKKEEKRRKEKKEKKDKKEKKEKKEKKDKKEKKEKKDKKEKKEKKEKKDKRKKASRRSTSHS